MSSQGNKPLEQGRQRRAERYAGEFLTEPSMSAPQPIPGEAGKQPRRAPEAAAEPQQFVQQPVPEGQGWQQYPPQGWQQPYPPQPAPEQGWSQQYAAQPVSPQGWQQPYPPQPVTEQGWQQPYGAQAVPPQGWQQPYGDPAAAAPQGSEPQGLWSGNGYMPPVTQDDGGSGDGKFTIPWKIVLIVLLAVAVLTGGVVGITHMNEQKELLAEVSYYNDRFCVGVYVDGVHLGGMTQEEALAAVNAHAQERLAAWNITLTYGGQLVRRITAADLGMTVNVNDALAEAWLYGHASSNVDERKAAMDALLENPCVIYTAMPSGDTSVVDRILYELAAPVYREPQDATVVFDPEAHSSPFEYTPEVYGSYLDVEPIKAEIYAMVEGMESGTIELVPVIIPPSVTEADLRAVRTLRGSATTDISTTSTDERTGNIQRAFQLINGTVLAPGATFSFNGVVGARTAKNGFLPAIEYAYGTERLGYGGGVCQASTTVYLAAVRSDMTVTHREPHSDKVNYTEYGLDATVNFDGKKIDLTFKNTTNSDVYIMAYLVRSGGRWVCHVDVYGEALPEGVTYDLIAETVEILPAPVDPEYVEDKTGEKVYYIDDEPVVKRKASDGYIVETFKVMYLNGVEVDRTYVARDTYKAKSQQLYVGIHDRE